MPPSHRLDCVRLATVTLLILAFAPSANGQEVIQRAARQPAPPIVQGSTGRRTPGFELGLGVGATRVSCATPCTGTTHFSAGPLIVFGGLIHPNIFVGGQIVGSALDDDGDNELALWAITPVVKYYPSRLFYIGGGVGYGEAEGKIEGGKLHHGIWAAELRAGWTVPWNRAITPYVSFFRPLSSLRAAGASEHARAHSFQLGVALSTPGSGG